MPIAKMARLTLIGLDSERDAVVEALLRLGAVQVDILDNSTGSTAARAGGSPATETGDGVFADLPALMRRLEQAVSFCHKYIPRKKPWFATKRSVTASQFDDVVGRRDQIAADLARLEAAQSHNREIDSRIVHLQNTIELINPWQSLDIDLHSGLTRTTRSFLGSLRTRTDLAALDEELAALAPETITEVLAEDESGLRVHVITLREREGPVQAALRRSNFRFLPAGDEQTTPRALLAQLREELAGLMRQREAENAVLQQIAERVADFEMLHDHLQMLRTRMDLGGHLDGTARTFILGGWLAAELAAPVTAALAARFTVAFTYRDAMRSESFPILLKNRKLVQPYEVVVEMFNPPLPAEIDPTPLIAPFYFLFFGMMLSDVGYGLLLTALCAIPLFKFKVKGRQRRAYLLFFECGLSSIFWGLMFGGYFGDMITAVTAGRFTIPPLLFDPVTHSTELMVISLGLGVIHLFAGMAAKAYIMVRSGDWRAALFDVLPWYCLILGLPLALAGIAAPTGLILSVAGALAIILFAGRDRRNPIVRVGFGLYTLYGITSYLGNILSYTRILALILATSVIAMVFNKIGMILGQTIPGYILFLVVALAGHAVNFALSALSAYIHTSRLHFVEFFGQFYQGGGRLFRPQQLAARYIEIERRADPAAEKTH
jgi:V/A-type H+/Na+-transporting ATPase subunit I